MRSAVTPDVQKINKNPDEFGATMVEYALLLALILVIVVSSVQILGERVNATFAHINSQMGEGSGESGGGVEGGSP